MTLNSELRRRIGHLADEFADAILEVAAQVIADHLRGRDGGEQVEAAPPPPPAEPKKKPSRARAVRVPAARVLRVVGAHPTGITADALREALGVEVGAPLPRALTVLVASGRVKQIVDGGRTRFAIPTRGPAPSANGVAGALAKGSGSPVAVKPAAPTPRTNGMNGTAPHVVRRSDTFFG